MPYRNRLASNVALNLAPAGQKGDSAEFLGDIFTMIDRASASDLLMGSVLSGNVELVYVIDNVASFTKNSDKPNFRGNTDALNKIGKANGYKPVVEKPAVVVDPVKAEAPKKAEPIEEPVKAETPVVPQAAPEAKAIEPTPVKAEEPVKVAEEPKQEPVADKVEDKPKRQRKIKVD